MIGFSINAQLVKKAIGLADLFLSVNEGSIPLAVRAQWRMMRPALEDWRAELEQQENRRG